MKKSNILIAILMILTVSAQLKAAEALAHPGPIMPSEDTFEQAPKPTLASAQTEAKVSAAPQAPAQSSGTLGSAILPTENTEVSEVIAPEPNVPDENQSFKPVSAVATKSASATPAVAVSVVEAPAAAPEAQPVVQSEELARPVLVENKSSARIEKHEAQEPTKTGFSFNLVYLDFINASDSRSDKSTGVTSSPSPALTEGTGGFRMAYTGKFNPYIGLDLGLSYISDFRGNDQVYQNSLTFGLLDLNLVGYFTERFYIYAGANTNYFLTASNDPSKYTSDVGGQAGLGLYLRNNVKAQVGYNLVRFKVDDYLSNNNIQLGGIGAQIGIVF